MAKPNRGPYLALNEFGKYEIRWTENGRSRRASTGETDHANAHQILAQFILLKNEADHKRGEGLNVTDCLTLYWREHVEPNVVGKETQEFAIAKLDAHFGMLEPAQVENADVASYIRGREEGSIGRPSRPGTIRRELSVLTAALNHAARTKRISRDDVPYVQMPPAGAPRERVLSQDEADRLVAIALGEIPNRLPRVYRFIMLALETAARPAAIRELKWSQVDFEHGIIRYNPEGRVQTKKRRVPLPISDPLRAVLDRAREEATTEYVLDHPGSVRTAFATIIRKADLEEVTPYTLRHTWATWAARRGENMINIAAVLGDRVETVSRNYIHHVPEYLRSTVNYERPDRGANRAATGR